MAVTDMHAGPRCTAFSKTTRKRCQMPAIRGGSVCRLHGGASPLAKAEAQRRIATLVDPALEVMYTLLMSKKTPAMTRVAIAKDILDRAGYRPPEKHEHEIAWDGNISTLNEEALERLAFYLERIAFGDDKARMLQEKRKAFIEAGVPPDVIEAEFREGDPDADPPESGEHQQAPSADDQNW